MRVLIAGGSGFIGRELQRALRAEGDEVRLLVRSASAVSDQSDTWSWNPVLGRGTVPAAALAWADGLVDLAGAPISQLPWTRARREGILGSRLGAVETLSAGLRRAADPPRVWVQASASGYYGSRPGEELPETAAAGGGFLAGVCRLWERGARADERTRIVRVRTGLALGPDAGSLPPLRTLARLGVTRIGSGEQHWPWISLLDEARAIAFALHGDLTGAVNLAGPHPATASHVLREIARRAGALPLRVPLPASVVQAALGDAGAELFLADQRLVPQRLIEAGFSFRHPTVADAVGWALASS